MANECDIEFVLWTVHRGERPNLGSAASERGRLRIDGRDLGVVRSAHGSDFLSSAQPRHSPVQPLGILKESYGARRGRPGSCRRRLNARCGRSGVGPTQHAVIAPSSLLEWHSLPLRRRFSIVFSRTYANAFDPVDAFLPSAAFGAMGHSYENRRFDHVW